jgi:hypothetical protein
MTINRRDQIIEAILGALDNMDGEQCREPILFASLEKLVPPPLRVSEFEAALRHCEVRRWILGLRPELGSVKWKLTDKGKAVYLENR